MSDQGKEAAMSLADQIEFVENNLAQHKAIVAELSSKVSGDWITKSKEAIDNYNAILATLKSLQATVSLPSEPFSEQQRKCIDRQRGIGMISAVGEYTPEEFWTLLDGYDQLHAAATTLAAQNWALRKLLQRIRAWDMMEATEDGKYWRAEIDALGDGK